ncbi:MAG: hypothetical protein JWO38_8226 [Gemmataceae bacterium]|nr:hypothetical protein [Gemmataceae bacterium]
MPSPARTAANKKNALKSTGPKTAAGKAQVARNALRTGLFARLAVVTGLGETVEAFAQFQNAVSGDLAPAGPVEGELADRIAVLMWRLRRVAVYEATAGTSPATLPPHPDEVVPADTWNCLAPPPDAPTPVHLAYARFTLITSRNSLEAACLAAAALLTPSPEAEPASAGDEPVFYRTSDHITEVAATLLDWPWVVRTDHWTAIARGVGAKFNAGGVIVWTETTLQTAIDQAARNAGRPVAEFRGEVRAHVDAERDALTARVAAREADEWALTDRLLGERIRAAAAGLFGDDGVLQRVAKAEGHLGRELERALTLLERLQAARRERPGPVGDGAGPGLRIIRAVESNGPDLVGFDLPTRLPVAEVG